jgi:aldehyde dehydrogenase (NAD+)
MEDLPGILPGILRAHREFFATGMTRDIEWRKSQLKKLKSVIKSKEAKINAALFADLGKGEFESYTSEIGFLYEEINVAMRNLD